MIYPYELPAPGDLNTLQLDGIECVYCADWTESPSKPVGHLRGALVFAHPDCAEEYRIDDALCNAAPQFGTARCHLPKDHGGECRARVKVGGEITFKKESSK